MTAVLVQTCDIHKTYSSSRPIGVFTNRKALDKCLRQSLRTKRIEIPDGSPINKKQLSQYSIDELHKGIDYISLIEIDLNHEF